VLKKIGLIIVSFGAFHTINVQYAVLVFSRICIYQEGIVGSYV